jgi:hypothetical protein
LGLIVELHMRIGSTTVGRTLLGRAVSPSQRDPYLTTHNTHSIQMLHAPGGIRTYDLSMRVASNCTTTGTGISLY